MSRELSLPLFWRVCLINGAVFLVGTLVLALSPATVSSRPLWSEVLVLLVGLVGIVVLNGILLRSVLRPLDRLTALMAEIDLRQPGLRLEQAGTGPATALVQGFNAMLERLEVERSTSRARVLNAQEAERRRIAQELHDEVGQSLTAVLLGLKQAMNIAPDDVVEELEQVRGDDAGQPRGGPAHLPTPPSRACWTTSACSTRCRASPVTSPPAAGCRSSAGSSPGCRTSRPRPSSWSTAWPRRP